MKVYVNTNKEEFKDELNGITIPKGKVMGYVTKENIPVNYDEEYYAEIDVSDEVLKNISNYVLKNGKLILDATYIDKMNTAYLRDKRSYLLEAFDKYNMAVTRNLIQETDEQREIVIKWYHAILNLEEDAIENPLECVLYYMK